MCLDHPCLRTAAYGPLRPFEALLKFGGFRERTGRSRRVDTTAGIDPTRTWRNGFRASIRSTRKGSSRYVCFTSRVSVDPRNGPKAPVVAPKLQILPAALGGVASNGMSHYMSHYFEDTS